jgi:hypothetical protein
MSVTGNTRAVFIPVMQAFIQLHWVWLQQTICIAFIGCHVPKFKCINTGLDMMIGNLFVLKEDLMPLGLAWLIISRAWRVASPYDSCQNFLLDNKVSMHQLPPIWNVQFLEIEISFCSHQCQDFLRSWVGPTITLWSRRGRCSCIVRG